MRLTKEDIAADAQINMLKYIRASTGFVVFINLPAFRGSLEFVAFFTKA
jgi:hypothetical protein